MTMISRDAADAPASLAFTKQEKKILDHLRPEKMPKNSNILSYVKKLAKLGGYLGRASDPPPGNQVIWRGLERLTDILLPPTHWSPLFSIKFPPTVTG